MVVHAKLDPSSTNTWPWFYGFSVDYLGVISAFPIGIQNDSLSLSRTFTGSLSCHLCRDKSPWKRSTFLPWTQPRPKSQLARLHKNNRWPFIFPRARATLRCISDRDSAPVVFPHTPHPSPTPQEKADTRGGILSGEFFFSRAT